MKDVVGVAAGSVVTSVALQIVGLNAFIFLYLTPYHHSACMTLTCGYRDEPFYHINIGMLRDLLLEYETDRFENVCGYEDDLSVGGPRIISYGEDDDAIYDRPYLLLDVREAHEFAANHIYQARSFPEVLLNQDKSIAELRQYRDKEGSLIVIYAEKEREACRVAQRLAEKGYNNIFLLTGGISAFFRLCPEFIEGVPDNSWLRDVSPRRARKREVQRRILNDDTSTLASLRLRQGSFRGGMTVGSGGRLPSVAGSCCTDTFSVAESIITRSAARKGRF